MGKKFSKLKGKDISHLRIANNRRRTLISRDEKIDLSVLETLILYVSMKFSKLKGKDIYITSKNSLRIIEGELLSLARRKSIEDFSVFETLILFVSMKFSKLKGKDIYISHLRIANNRRRTLIFRGENRSRKKRFLSRRGGRNEIGGGRCLEGHVSSRSTRDSDRYRSLLSVAGCRPGRVSVYRWHFVLIKGGVGTINESEAGN